MTPSGSRISESGPRIPESGPSFPHDENLIADLATEKFKRQPDFDHNSNFGHFLRLNRDPGFLRMARKWRIFFDPMLSRKAFATNSLK